MNFRERQRLNKRKVKVKKGIDLRVDWYDWRYGAPNEVIVIQMFDNWTSHIQGESYLD